MADATRLELRHDIGWTSGKVLYDSARRSSGKRTGTENEHWLLAIRPFIELQNRFESFASYDQGVNCGHEFMVTVRFTTPRRKEIKSAIRSRYETIETCADKNRSLHCAIPPLESLLITQRRMWPVKIAFTMTNVNAAARQRRIVEASALLSLAAYDLRYLSDRVEAQDGRLLLAAIALDDHKFVPCLSVVRLLTSPSEVRLGSARVCGARIRVRGIDRCQLFEGIGD